MKILKAVFLLLMFSMVVSAQTVTPDVSGKWGVTYEGNTHPSVSITLFVSTATAEHPMDELSGIYHDDVGGICPVKGATLGAVFNLTVVCTKDQIEFNSMGQFNRTALPSPGRIRWGWKADGRSRWKRLPVGCRKVAATRAPASDRNGPPPSIRPT